MYMLEDYRKLWEKSIDELNQSESPIPRLLANRFTSKRFDTTPVPEKHMKEIMDSIQWTPCKGAVQTFKVWAITDSSEGKDLKQTIYKEVATTSPLKAKELLGEVTNPQVLAPLVLVFWSYRYGEEDGYIGYDLEQKEIVDGQINSNYDGHNTDPIAMAAMNAILTAESLGLNTAYCKCFNEPGAKKLLAGNKDKNYKQLELMVGIGYNSIETAQNKKCFNIGNANAKTRTDLFTVV